MKDGVYFRLGIVINAKTDTLDRKMFFNNYEANLLSVIHDFLSYKITANDFAANYSNAWRCYRDSSLPKGADIATQNFFDMVFTAVDCYCSDPELRDEEDYDEKGLFDEVKKLKDIHFK